MSTTINIENANGYTLKNLSGLNILMGKNGCGKSTLLRLVEQWCSTQNAIYGRTKYITPERGGALIYEAGIEQAILNPNWMADNRRKNQSRNLGSRASHNSGHWKQLSCER